MSEVPTLFTPGAHGVFVAAALDTETTGLSSETDQIIELGIRLFRFEWPSGKILDTIETFAALQDPGFLISPEIQSVTGITPLMLVDQRIDWELADRLLAKADVLIAHNAKFDRGFVDQKSHVSRTKVWACSAWQVDWRSKGFKNARLQDLCASLGLSYTAHRALNDVDALMRLIGGPDAMNDNRPYLCELIASASQEISYLWVEGKTYDQRDLLKAHGFRWDPDGKTWGKIVPATDASQAAEFAQSVIPETRVLSRAVPLWGRFSRQAP